MVTTITITRSALQAINPIIKWLMGISKSVTVFNKFNNIFSSNSNKFYNLHSLSHKYCLPLSSKQRKIAKTKHFLITNFKNNQVIVTQRMNSSLQLQLIWQRRTNKRLWLQWILTILRQWLILIGEWLFLHSILDNP